MKTLLSWWNFLCTSLSCVASYWYRDGRLMNTKLLVDVLIFLLELRCRLQINIYHFILWAFTIFWYVYYSNLQSVKRWFNLTELQFKIIYIKMILSYYYPTPSPPHCLLIRKNNMILNQFEKFTDCKTIKIVLTIYRYDLILIVMIMVCGAISCSYFNNWLLSIGSSRVNFEI